MKNHAPLDPYRIMTPPVSRARRLVGYVLGVLLAISFALASFYFGAAIHAPLRVPLASALIGLILGPLLFASSLRWYATGKGRYLPSLLIVMVATMGRGFVAWLAGQPNSFHFFLTYFLALMAGFCLSLIMVSWKWGLRPFPITPLNP